MKVLSEIMGKAFGKRRTISLLLILAVAVGFPAPSAAGSITAEEIKMAVIHYVESNMHWEPGTIRMDCKSRLSEMVVPGANLTLEVTARPDQDFIGDTAFQVKYYSGETLVKEEPLRVTLEALRDLVVSTKALPKDKVITGEDVRVIKKWVRRLPEKVAIVSEDVVGKILMVNIKQNNEIARNVIKEPRLIKKGNTVRIIVDNGDFSITTIGVSEENGIAESLIRVKNVSSNKVIFARVIGDSLVKVEF
jgi:flagella basal body P-ring formation protein FlgA